jgi:hypothetical protein
MKNECEDCRRLTSGDCGRHGPQIISPAPQYNRTILGEYTIVIDEEDKRARIYHFGKEIVSARLEKLAAFYCYLLAERNALAANCYSTPEAAKAARAAGGAK